MINRESTWKLLVAVLILFGLLVLYQILRKLFGGSWSAEDIILALLLFNIGCTFTIGLMVAQLRSDHDHLKDSFQRLATDFKEDHQKP